MGRSGEEIYAFCCEAGIAMCKSSRWVDTVQVKLSLIILMMMMRFDDALLYSTDRRMF